jgi:hypothetical protein
MSTSAILGLALMYYKSFLSPHWEVKQAQMKQQGVTIKQQSCHYLWLKLEKEMLEEQQL